MTGVMRMNRGAREFRDRILRCDHIVVSEGYVGWFVDGRWEREDFLRYGIANQFHIGPFRTKRDAVAWLKSWIGDTRPLTTDRGGGGGWWHWFADHRKLVA